MNCCEPKGHGGAHQGMHHGMHHQSCCCCGDSSRRFLTKKEKIEKLEEYKEQLEKELEGVKEHIKHMSEK